MVVVAAAETGLSYHPVGVDGDDPIHVHIGLHEIELR